MVSAQNSPPCMISFPLKDKEGAFINFEPRMKAKSVTKTRKGCRGRLRNFLMGTCHLADAFRVISGVERNVTFFPPLRLRLLFSHPLEMSVHAQQKTQAGNAGQHQSYGDRFRWIRWAQTSSRCWNLQCFPHFCIRESPSCCWKHTHKKREDAKSFRASLLRRKFRRKKKDFVLFDFCDSSFTLSLCCCHWRSLKLLPTVTEEGGKVNRMSDVGLRWNNNPTFCRLRETFTPFPAQKANENSHVNFPAFITFYGGRDQIWCALHARCYQRGISD